MIQEALAERGKKQYLAGQWITAIGVWTPDLWSEHRAAHAEGTGREAAPDRPVFLFEGFNGAAATNTLGKKFFDDADAGPLPHPDYRGVKVAANGAIGASHVTNGEACRPVHFTCCAACRFSMKRFTTRSAPWPIQRASASLHGSIKIRSTRWDRCIRGRAQRPSTLIGSHDSVELMLHRQGRMTMQAQMDFTCFAEVRSREHHAAGIPEESIALLR